MGFLVDFLSHAAIVGFVAGAAIVIGLQQFKGLLGITHFTTKTDIISVMKAVWEALHNPVCRRFSFSIHLLFLLPINWELVEIKVTKNKVSFRQVTKNKFKKESFHFINAQPSSTRFIAVVDPLLNDKFHVTLPNYRHNW